MKRGISTSTRIRIIFFLKRDARVSASSRLQCQVEINIDVSTSANEMQFWSWREWFGHHLVPRVSILLLRRQQKERREMLGTRLISPDIRSTCVCATFCFHVHYLNASTGAGIRKRKKCVWPCACFYAYVVSFSRHALFYLRLCLPLCLRRHWKQRFFASTHAQPVL